MSDAHTPETLGAEEAAARLGINPQTLGRLARAGKIGCYRIGRLRRYSASHLAAYLATCEQRPVNESAA